MFLRSPLFAKAKKRQTGRNFTKPSVMISTGLITISGIELSGSTSANCLGALELASSWIIGEAGDVKDQEENAKIIKLVIAGNSLSSETRDKKILSTAKYLTSGQEASSGI